VRCCTLTLAVCDVQHFTLALARLRVGTGASRAVLVNALWVQRLAVRVIVDSVAKGGSLVSYGNCYSWARMAISSARSAITEVNLMSMLCT